MSLFWRLEQEIGLQETIDCFQKALDLGREEMEYDVMGCRDCWVHSDIVYCEKSKFHPNHPHHCCPPWQNCYCLASEYSSDLSALVHNFIIISLANGCGILPPFYVTNFLAKV